MNSTADLVKQALERQECVLERGTERLVVMLDGKTVVTQGAKRESSSHFNSAAAKDAFIAAIEGAVRDGFSAAHRDPPKAVPFHVTPRVEEPAPAPRSLTVKAPPGPPPANDGDWPDAWEVRPPRVKVTISGIDDDEYPILVRGEPLEGVDHVEIEAFDGLEANDVLAAEGVPPWATGLTFMSYEAVEEFEATGIDVGPLCQHFTNLRRLELRAGEFTWPTQGELQALPNLRHLEVWCLRPDDALVAALAAKSWPTLTTLRLWLSDFSLARLEPLLVAPLFPRLARLGVHAVDVGTPEQASAFAAKFKASALGSQLESFDSDVAAWGRPFPEADGIEVLSTGRYYPLRASEDA